MDRLPPLLLAQAEAVLSYQQDHIHLSGFGSSNTRDPSPPTDRFQVTLPHCDAQLCFHVLFDARDVRTPPDLVFCSDEDDAIFDLSALTSLSQSWNVDEPRSLLMLLLEVRFVYVRAQWERVEAAAARVSDTSLRLNVQQAKRVLGAEALYQDHRIKFVLPLDLVAEVTDELHRQGKVLMPHEYFRLALEFKANSFEDVTKPVQVKLLSPPQPPECDVERGLPKWKGHLVQAFVTEVQTHVGKVLGAFFGERKQRLALCAELISTIGPPAEWDSEHGRRLLFHLEEGKQREAVLMLVSLNTPFPAVVPTITLISPHFRINHKQLSKQITRYKYSPRWSPEQMTEGMVSELRALVPKFIQWCRQQTAQ